MLYEKYGRMFKASYLEFNTKYISAIYAGNSVEREVTNVNAMYNAILLHNVREFGLLDKK